jgi:hypothetical protein
MPAFSDPATLDAWLDGRLDPELAAAFDAALAEDPELAAALEAHLSVDLHLRALGDAGLRAALMPDLPADAREALALPAGPVAGPADPDALLGAAIAASGPAQVGPALGLARLFGGPAGKGAGQRGVLLGLGGLLMAASALLLLRPAPAPPAYAPEWQNAAQELRGDTSQPVSGAPRFKPGNRATLVLRPDRAPEGPLEARARVRCGGAPVAVQPAVEVAPTGAVRVQVDLPLDLASGPCTVDTWVHPAGEAGEGAPAASAPFVVVRAR